MKKNVVVQFDQHEKHNRFAGVSLNDLNPVEQQRLVAMALTVMEHRYQPGAFMGSPVEAKAYLRLRLAERQAEVFACLFLDTRHRVICFEEMFQGTIDGASVYPRVVVQRALEVNASAVVLTHNHPSGDPEPSPADITLTQRLKGALGLVDIRILDHIVIGAASTVSFAERGML